MPGNPGTWEAGRSEVQDQPWLYIRSEFEASLRGSGVERERVTQILGTFRAWEETLGRSGLPVFNNRGKECELLLFRGVNKLASS